MNNKQLFNLDGHLPVLFRHIWSIIKKSDVGLNKQLESNNFFPKLVHLHVPLHVFYFYYYLA